MKKKILFILVFLLALILPKDINALTKDEATSIIDNFGDEIAINSINPDLFKLDIEEYDLPYFYENAIKFYLKENNYDLDNITISDMETNDKATIRVSYTDNNSDLQLTKEVRVKYLDNYDKDTFNKAFNIIKSLEDNYYLQGINSINNLYHYGSISNNDYKTSTILARFSKLKEIIERNPEFDFEILLGRGGGTPFGESRYASVSLYKDDVLYAYKEVILNVETVIYVDKALSGTIYDKAKDRLNKYFNNKVNVSFDMTDINTFEDDDYANNYLNGLLKTNEKYNIANLKLNLDNKSFYVTLIEVDKKFIDTPNVTSIDDETGINVYTESYDVPLDSSIKTNNVSEEEYVSKFVKNNKIDLEYAYDINLIKAYDKNYVTNIENGIDVYIPVSNYKKGDKVTVYYVKDDSSIGEKITGEVVEINNKLYIKFTTTHFSTYAVEKLNNTNNEVINNPNTSDNIFIYIITFIISLVSIGLYINKNKYSLK